MTVLCQVGNNSVLESQGEFKIHRERERERITIGNILPHRYSYSYVLLLFRSAHILSFAVNEHQSLSAYHLKVK